MNKKIIYTVLILLAIVAGGILLLDVANYEVSQEYAIRAADQLNDDAAYTELKTQSGVNRMFNYIYYGVSLILVIIGIKIWIPKKSKTII